MYLLMAEAMNNAGHANSQTTRLLRLLCC